MLKSNNFNSIIDDLAAFSGTDNNNFEALQPQTLDLETTQCAATIQTNSVAGSKSGNITVQSERQQDNHTHSVNNNVTSCPVAVSGSSKESSLAALQLTAGLMQSFTPPLAKARSQLKELIGKQNKIYIDLSTEKYKLDNSEVAKLQDMMNDVKVYREKLNKIKKQMQNIYQKSKVLKKRALHIQACKEKEHQRKVQKQQQEESLIGKQQ